MADPIFSDNFETGNLNAWNSVTRASIVAGIDGSYGVDLEEWSPYTSTDACLIKVLTAAMSAIYLSLYLKANVVASNNGSVIVFLNGTTILGMLVAENTSATKFQLVAYQGNFDTELGRHAVDLDQDVVYDIAIKYIPHASAGTFQVKLNDVLVINVTAAATAPSTLDVNIFHLGDVNLGDALSFSFQADDVIVNGLDWAVLPDYVPSSANVLICSGGSACGGELSLETGALVSGTFSTIFGCICGGSLSFTKKSLVGSLIDCYWYSTAGGSLSLTKGKLPTSIPLSCKLGLRPGGQLSLAVTLIPAKVLSCTIIQKSNGSFKLASSMTASDTNTIAVLVKQKTSGQFSLEAGSLTETELLTCSFALKSSGSFGLNQPGSPASRELTFSSLLQLVGGSLGLTSNIYPAVDLLLSGGTLMGGSLYNQESVNNTWAITDDGFQVSIFTNFNFTSFSEFEGRLYATGPDGIYLLGAATDEGRKIVSSLRINSRFGSNRIKKLKRLFCNGENPDLQLRVEVDEAETYYDLIDEETRFPGNQVRFRPKLKGRNFTLDILNFEELSLVDFIYSILGK